MFVCACVCEYMLVCTCLCLCLFKPGLHIWELMWGGVVTFICAHVKRQKTKNKEHTKKFAWTNASVCPTASVWVECVHAWWGNQWVCPWKPAAASWLGSVSASFRPAAPQLTSGGYQSNKDAQQCNYSASHNLWRHFFSPHPSLDVPVSFILMVRKSLCSDKTGSILEEGNEWRCLAAVAVTALDVSKQLPLARSLFLKDTLWDFCCRKIARVT